MKKVISLTPNPSPEGRGESVGAAGPNPAVVRAIFERMAEWQEEQAAGASSAGGSSSALRSAQNVPPSAQREEATTERVYQQIVDHGEAHRVAIEKMTAAVGQNDHEAAKKYFDEAKYHEQMQREAGMKARSYFLSKARHSEQLSVISDQSERGVR